MIARKIARMVRPNDYYDIDLNAHTLRSFVMFIGFGRSGHSIVGQIINAHPNALIADEAPIFDELGRSPSLEQTIDYLKERDRAFALRWFNKDSPIHRSAPLSRLFRPRGKRRNFRFPGLYQGFVKLPSVIGNSKAGYTSRHIAQDPDLIPAYEESVGLPMKFVCIMRNPFDMIASGMRRREASFDDICSNFEEMSDYVQRSLSNLGDRPVLMLRQEDFLSDASAGIDRLFSFLELPVATDFKDIIRGRLFTEPQKSRYGNPAVAENRARVETLIAQHDFFEGYSYDS